jgi:hypothetical protein
MLLVAGLLLAARRSLRQLGLSHPSVDAILTATGVGRTRAYALRDSILRVLPSLQRAPGRPRSAPEPVSTSHETLVQRVLDFIMAHPGCAVLGAQRREYSEEFKCFIAELREQHGAMTLPVFAEAVRVPLGTLEEWLRLDVAATSRPEPTTTSRFSDPVASTRVQTVIDAWKGWQGSFSSFCTHVKEQLRIPYGRTFISSILEIAGVRRRRRRPGRSPDEKALRGTFETFFPGAQWVGDGSPVEVRLSLGGHEYRFGFNLELMTDAQTGGFVGLSVRDEEDGPAVTEAFDDGVDTTGGPPLALLLDSRPSNHTEEVDEALGETFRIRATRGRAQNKAHTEGGFGLFKSTAPELMLSAQAPHELAERILELVAQTWARTLNHRPRKNRGGLSRVELYDKHEPTAEEVEHARQALEERRRKQEKALETRQARQDPVARAILDAAFARLALLDPDGNIRSAIARYPLDAILAGIATFEGKRDAGTLPPGVDARYMKGIVRNIAQQDEGLRISELLLERRLEARDLALGFLELEKDAIMQSRPSARDRMEAFLKNALTSERYIDSLFWFDATADVIETADAAGGKRDELFTAAARRVHAAYRLPYERRLAAVRFLARRAVPLS